MRPGFTLIELMAVLMLLAVLAALAAPALRAHSELGRVDSAIKQRSEAIRERQSSAQLDTGPALVARFMTPDGFAVVDSSRQLGTGTVPR